jgi:hypothetical protein
MHSLFNSLSDESNWSGQMSVRSELFSTANNQQCYNENKYGKVNSVLIWWLTHLNVSPVSLMVICSA